MFAAITSLRNTSKTSVEIIFPCVFNRSNLEEEIIQHGYMGWRSGQTPTRGFGPASEELEDVSIAPFGDKNKSSTWSGSFSQDMIVLPPLYGGLFDNKTTNKVGDHLIKLYPDIDYPYESGITFKVTPNNGKPPHWVRIYIAVVDSLALKPYTKDQANTRNVPGGIEVFFGHSAAHPETEKIGLWGTSLPANEAASNQAHKMGRYKNGPLEDMHHLIVIDTYSKEPDKQVYIDGKPDFRQSIQLPIKASPGYIFWDAQAVYGKLPFYCQNMAGFALDVTLSKQGLIVTIGNLISFSAEQQANQEIQELKAYIKELQEEISELWDLISMMQIESLVSAISGGLIGIAGGGPIGGVLNSIAWHIINNDINNQKKQGIPKF